MSLSPWILSPLVWFFLPGFALMPRRRNGALRLLPVVGLSFVITSALSLSLVFLGLFDARLVTGLLLLFLPVAVVLWKRGPAAPGGNGLRLAARVPSALMFVIAMCILPQFARTVIERQPFQGACDAGVYLAAAERLDGAGRFDWEPGELLPAQPTERELSIRTTPYHYPWRETWPGIVLVGDRIAPQFFPLYPAWISLFHSAFADHPFFHLNLWSLAFAVLFLLWLSRSLVPWRAAWTAGLVILLNPGIIHFWDYPLAELFLAFIVIGMLAFLQFGLRYRIRSFLVLAACFLAAGLATKYMAWFLLAPLAMLWVLSDRKGFLARHFFGIPLLLAGIVPALCLALWNHPHFLNHFLPRERLAQAAAFGLGLLAAWALSRMECVRRWAPPAVGVLFTAAIAAFLFILPRAVESGEENVLPELAWYTGWGWLVLAFIGAWVLLMRKGKEAGPVMICFLLMLGVALAGTADNPLHPFAFRRHIPVLVPLIALMSAVALHWLRHLGRVALTAIVLLSAVPPMVFGYAMMASREGKGFLPLLNGIANELPGGPVYGLDDAGWLSSQLQLLAKKPVYPLHLETAGSLADYQAHAASGERIRVLTGQALPYRKLGEWSGAIEHLRPERNRRPSVRETRPARLFLYDIGMEGTLAGDRLDVGGDDFGRVAGFWGPERDGERAFRWSGPWCHFILRTGHRLVITMNAAGHAEDPVPFRVYVGEELIAEGFAAKQWREYAIDLPVRLRGRPAAYSLVTHTFQPFPDTRALGLMISTIQGE